MDPAETVVLSKAIGQQHPSQYFYTIGEQLSDHSKTPARPITRKPKPIGCIENPI